jgi:hypothetical protein
VTATEKKRNKISKEQEDENNVRMMSKKVTKNMKLETQERS